MKQKIISLLLIFTVLFSFSIPSFAATNEDTNLSTENEALVLTTIENVAELHFNDIDSTSENSEQILPLASDIGNYITVSVSALRTNPNTVAINLSNIGPDNIDTVGLEVTVSGTNKTTTMNVVPKSYSPGSHNIDLTIRQHSVSEKITIQIYAQESGQSAIGQASATRNINSSFVAAWAPGSLGTSEKSLNYHYWKHRNDDCLVGIRHILDYCQSANSFLSYLKQQHIKGTYNSGATANAYKFYDNVSKQYMIAVGNSNREAVGPIVSYGGNTLTN